MFTPNRSDLVEPRTRFISLVATTTLLFIFDILDSLCLNLCAIFVPIIAAWLLIQVAYYATGYSVI